MSQEMKSKAALIPIGIVFLLTSCSQAAIAPPSPLDHPSHPAIEALPPIDADQYRHLFDYDESMPLDIQEEMRGQHLGVVAQDFTYISPKGGRVPATILTPPGRGPFAGIVMMHGMPSDRMQMLRFATAYACMGAKVILIDAPFARPENAGRPEPLAFTEQDREEQIQLIVDLRRAIDILISDPDVDPNRLAYIGVSYGAAMGGLLAGVEDRLQAYVLEVGDGGLVTHVLSAQDPSFYALSQAQQDAWIESMWPIEPLHYVERAAPAVILYLNGTLDQAVPAADALAFQEVGSQPKTVLWYEAGHMLPSQAAKDQVAWLEDYLSGGNLYLVGPSFRASAIVIDRVLLVWFALAAGALVCLLIAVLREGQLPWSIKLFWLIVVLFFGPVGLLVYFVSMRGWKGSEEQEGGSSILRQALGSTVWAMSGNLVGVMLVLAAASVIDTNEVVVIIASYVMAVITGLIISGRVKRSSAQEGGGREGPGGVLFPQIVSTNLALTGAGPVFMLLTSGWLELWYPLGFDLGSPPIWAVLSLAAIAGALIAYPLHVWLIRRGLIQWMPRPDVGDQRGLPGGSAGKLRKTTWLAIIVLTYVLMVAAFAISM
jgi:dienelactone hydrolase